MTAFWLQRFTINPVDHQTHKGNGEKERNVQSKGAKRLGI
jgi:hypothetical protein